MFCFYFSWTSHVLKKKVFCFYWHYLCHMDLIFFSIWRNILFFGRFVEKKKVWLAFNKLDSESMEWWEDIQIDRNHQGKHSIFSWKRTKKVLIDLWFPLDYYDRLDYTSVNIDLYIHMKRNMFKTWKANHIIKIITSRK